MFEYQLKMAGIIWHIISPMELPPDEKIQPFITRSVTSDVRIRFQMGHPDTDGVLKWEKAPRVWRNEHGYWVERLLTAKLSNSTCIYLDDRNPFEISGWIFPDRKEDIRTMESLLDVSEIEILLSFFGVVSLHSSLIRWKDRGVLFTAPSGTGKSTQAELWEKCRGAEILNGDRSMIRNMDTGWTAFGSPFAGSSAIYRNESAPVRAIVVLRQSEKNRICRLGVAEAFRCLYSETVIPIWHAQAHQEVIHLVEQLASDVPVLLMHCTPDENAVDTLESFLENEL